MTRDTKILCSIYKLIELSTGNNRALNDDIERLFIDMVERIEGVPMYDLDYSDPKLDKRFEKHFIKSRGE